jgi:hypothetical protein
MTTFESHGEERRALELLPWYVNGTLEGAERELVGRQVRTSLTCRKELERLRRLQKLIQRDDAEAAETDLAFERLMARIRASDAQGKARPQLGATKTAWTRWAIAASLAAATVAGWAWWTATPDLRPRLYETLTAPSPADVRIRIVFAPGVSETERQQLLASHGLSVVGSPTQDGIVTLAFKEDADRAAIVAALKQDARIAFVTTPPETHAP